MCCPFDSEVLPDPMTMKQLRFPEVGKPAFALQHGVEEKRQEGPSPAPFLPLPFPDSYVQVIVALLFEIKTFKKADKQTQGIIWRSGKD